MLSFLRSLAPRHGDALRSASPVRRFAKAAWPADDGTSTAFDERVEVSAARPPTSASTRDEHPMSATERTSSPQAAPSRTVTVEEKSGASAGTTRTPGTIPAATKFAEVADAMLKPTGLRRDAPPFLETPARRHRDLETSVAASADVPHGSVDAAPRTEHTTSAPSPVARTAPISPITVSLSAPRTTPAVPPAIHVTIDRIEVRAPAVATPTPRPTRPRPAPPSPSLHDYLRGKASS